MAIIYRIFFIFCFSVSSANAEVEYIDLEISKHTFIPKIIYASVNKIIKIRVANLDSTIEEFESFDLKREKIVPANGSITVIVGPLSPGEYSFFGEFHPETAQGKLIVK
jgi:hypothetical protein